MERKFTAPEELGSGSTLSTTYLYSDPKFSMSWQGKTKPNNGHLEGFRVPESVQKMPGTFGKTEAVNTTSNNGSAVSNLFDHMYQSSVCGGRGTSNHPHKNLGGSSSNICSTVDASRSSSRTYNDRPVASQMQPVHGCRSQNDLLGREKNTKYIESDLNAKKGSEFGDYDNCTSNRHRYDGGIRYQGHFSEEEYWCKAETPGPQKLVFLPSPLPTNKDQAGFKGNNVPVSVGSDQDYDYTESEEPLPCDVKPGQTAAFATRGPPPPKLDHNNSSQHGLHDSKDKLPMVFQRDVSMNKSFDVSAKKYDNQGYVHNLSDGRSGSMPYRIKKSATSSSSYKSISPLEANKPNDVEAISPVMPSKQEKPISVTKESSGSSTPVFQDTSQQFSAPAYTGPRLISAEKIKDSVSSESVVVETSEGQDKASAQRLAKQLFDLNGFQKSDVAKHLGKRSEFAQLVREAYLNHFDFSSMPIDGALRHFLKHLVLSGETQERERILNQFSYRFYKCNPHSFDSQDSIHVLVCSIMLLNTDLHGENGRKKMTVHEFVENLSGLNGGANFPKDLLKNIYHSIKNEPIEFQFDECNGSLESQKKKGQSVSSNANPFLDIPDPGKAHEFKSGYLMRKCCLESDGRRTPMGKRGWKKFRASLRDLILYLHKDEHGFSCGTTFDDTSNAIHIHHALAEDASDYNKRHCVFRIRTADWAEYLFQTSDDQECQSWIEVINQVAAAFSAAPLPGAVGSSAKFQRPLMPSSSAKLPLREKLIQHEQTLIQIKKDLADHRDFAPEKGSRPRIIQDYLEKETYLQFEERRFQAYCSSIKKMLLSSTDPDKALTGDGYFERSQSSGRFPNKLIPKDGNNIYELNGERKHKESGMANLTVVPVYHGLHPAKSVPALLFESRV